MVGLISTTSSRFWITCPVLRNSAPSTGMSPAPGTCERSDVVAWRIRPPMATMRPSWLRTMLSISDVLEAASGSLSEPALPRSTSLLTVVTWLTEGCTCRMMLPSASICGVTSSTTPEKKGCRVTLGLVVAPLDVVLVVVDTPVT